MRHETLLLLESIDVLKLPTRIGTFVVYTIHELFLRFKFWKNILNLSLVCNFLW